MSHIESSHKLKKARIMVQTISRKTIKAKKSATLVEPIHATIDPVRAYASEMSLFKGEPFSVIEIPNGSAAFALGYRFASVPDTELAYYLENGARST
jgi:hypothetical protein